MLLQNLLKNKILFWLGLSHLFVFIVLLIYAPFNKTEVLGINALIKPMKFALSIWVYSWTMTLILNYVNDNRKVKIYSWGAVICMGFEQVAITSQAFRGELSHFNRANVYGIILYSLMGVFILTITIWTAYVTYIFIKQKSYSLHPTIVLSIKIGLIYFIAFSLFGGYISSLPGHTVGGVDGGKGIFFLNWSTILGDLRVAHFFGIHSLQIIPLIAMLSIKYLDSKKSKQIVIIFSTIYLVFVLFTLVQSLVSLPLIKH
jgi:hypothetical protein